MARSTRFCWRTVRGRMSPATARPSTAESATAATTEAPATSAEASTAESATAPAATAPPAAPEDGETEEAPPPASPSHEAEGEEDEQHGQEESEDGEPARGRLFCRRGRDRRRGGFPDARVAELAPYLLRAGGDGAADVTRLHARDDLLADDAS